MRRTNDRVRDEIRRILTHHENLSFNLGTIIERIVGFRYNYYFTFLHFPDPLPPNDNGTLSFLETEQEFSADNNTDYLPHLVPGHDPSTTTGWVGLFGRRLGLGEPQNHYCTQFLLVWDFQLFPYHEMDYAPCFFVGTAPTRMAMLYDRGHYEIGRRWIRDPDHHVQIKINPLWRSFATRLVNEPPPDNNPLESIIQPLSDNYLQYWWELEEKLQLKIHGKLRSPDLAYNDRPKIWYNPHPMPLIEALQHAIKYPFIYYVLKTKSLTECLTLMNQELLSDKPNEVLKEPMTFQRDHSVEFFKCFSGLNALLAYLIASKLIDVKEGDIERKLSNYKEISLIFFLNLALAYDSEYPDCLDDRETWNFIKKIRFLEGDPQKLLKKMISNTELKLFDTDLGKGYFKILKGTIKSDGFLKLEMRDWNQKYSFYYNSEFTDLLNRELPSLSESVRKGWRFKTKYTKPR